MGFLGPVNTDGLLIHGWPVAVKQATDGLSKTLLAGERTYQIRTWMSWPGPKPPRPIRMTLATPDPRWSTALTALYATKNLTDQWPINHDPYTACYMDHRNDAGDRPEVPDSTPRRISPTICRLVASIAAARTSALATALCVT